MLFFRNNIVKTRFLLLVFFLLAAICVLPGRPDAHMLGYMEQNTIFYREGGFLYFRYESQFDQNLSYVMNPYLKGDGTIAEKNRSAFIDLMDSIIVPYLEIKVNDNPVSIERTDFVFTPKAGMQGGMFTAVTYRVILPEDSSGTCRFFFHDRTHIGDDIDGHSYKVDESAGAENISISSNTLEITFQFDTAPPAEVAADSKPVTDEPAPASETQPAETPEKSAVVASAESTPQEQPPAAEEAPVVVQTQKPRSTDSEQDEKPQKSSTDHATDTLTGFVRSEKLSISMILVALATSFILGMVHSLSPGHGKAMVAAYLVGTRGRIRDAVVLGIIVTSTHVFSVIVLGLLILFVSQFIVPQRIYPWIGVGSGLLVAAVGYWMLASRALGLTPGTQSHSHHPHDHHDHNHNHVHGHSHDHGHSHSHVPEGNVTFGSLLALGIAGGMVPCPSALVVLLLSVAVNRVLFGLAMILVFSLGMALVLILIGILTVTASQFSGVFSSHRKWIQRLPVFSAGLIMIIGVAIAINSLLAAGILTFTP